MAGLQRFLVFLSLSISCCADGDGDKDKQTEKAKGANDKNNANENDKVPDHVGPAKWGDPNYWVSLKGIGFSEGNLDHNFEENRTEYNLMIHNGKAKTLLVTVQLNTDKYDLQEIPVLVWNNKEMKYSPIDTIEFNMSLDENIGELNKDATLTVKDKEASGIFGAQTRQKTYTIHVTQIPDIEQIVTAKSITVTDLQGKVYQASPPYNPRTQDNEIVYYVDDDVSQVRVTVVCPPEASQLKYNGIPRAVTDTSPYQSHEIEGASKAILAQCIYKDAHWTKDKEMQRTYVIKILRNHELHNTHVSLRVWPPDAGLCKTHTSIDDKKSTPNYEFVCMGYTSSVPLLGTYTEPKAELIVVNKDNGARYRLWNGIPSHIPLVDPPPKYELLLQAGQHTRSYPFNLMHPPTCDHLNCSEGTMFENQGYPDLFRWWSGDSTNEYCAWEPCVIQDDFKHCCKKKGATCDTFELCKDEEYREENRNTCPISSDWRINGSIIYPDNYTEKKQWSCPKVKEGPELIISPDLRCAWTPCLFDDNNNSHCCGTTGAASCRTMKCPLDMVVKASAMHKQCIGSPCREKDTFTCCGYRPPCTSMTCPNGYSLKYNAAMFLCAGEECTNIDRDQCCDSAAFCDSWTCPPLWEKKEDAEIIPCGGYPCMEWDTGLCCNMKGMCSTLTCPSGYFKVEHATTTPCAGIANRTCNLEIDLHKCCATAAKCTESYVCDEGHGYKLKLNAAYLSCPGAKCHDSDRNLCCDMVDPFKAAKQIVVSPGKNEGSCEKKDAHDGELHFECNALKGVDTMNLEAKFTFDQEVGNQIYFKDHLITGASASLSLGEIPVTSEGKTWTLSQHFRVAGRTAEPVTGKISVYMDSASDSSSGEDGESVLRKLAAERQDEIRFI